MSGVVVAGGSCASWTVDGGVLHVYDLAGDARELSAVVQELSAIANEVFAAVLSSTSYSDDPRLDQLLALGFVVDWKEADVRAGKPVDLVSLVRDVTPSV